MFHDTHLVSGFNHEARLNFMYNIPNTRHTHKKSNTFIFMAIIALKICFPFNLVCLHDGLNYSSPQKKKKKIHMMQLMLQLFTF